jgi:hypothetical protein
MTTTKRAERPPDVPAGLLAVPRNRCPRLAAEEMRVLCPERLRQEAAAR